MKLRLDYSFACGLIFFLGMESTAQVYDNWNFGIKAQNIQLTDSLAMLGVRPDATADFDNSYDIPRPPRAPSGNYLEVYFPHSGGNYPPLLGTKYAVDYQGPDDPSWNISIEASAAGQITITWDSSYVGSIDTRVKLYLRDIGGGAVINMRTGGSYSFYYSTKRNFEIVGAVDIGLTYLMEGFWNGTTQIGDTISGYLASALSPHAIVDSARLFLSGSGNGNLLFLNASSGDYYLAIRHRNHIQIWSAAPLSLVKGTTSMSDYDFSAGPGTAYGVDALKQEGGVYVSWGGDVNQDGVIDFLDRNLTWNNRSLNGYLPTDCNGDNITNEDDYTVVLDNRLKIFQRP